MKNYNNIIAKYLMEGELVEKLATVPEELIPMRNAMIDGQKALEDVLTEEQKPLFDKNYDCTMEYKDAMEQHHFSEGFKAGLLIGLQIKGLPAVLPEQE